MSVRERGEPEARFLARAIPEEARVVGLVYPTSAAARSAAAATGIASAVGLRREHTLLAGTESGPGTLDETVGGGDGPGLGAALAGRAGLTEVARRTERWPYTYLPVGAAPPAPAALLGDPALRRFAARVRERGGTLLLHLPEEALPRAGGLLDGYVSLGKLSVPAPEGVETYGRVVFPDEDGEEEDGAGSATPAPAARPEGLEAAVSEDGGEGLEVEAAAAPPRAGGSPGGPSGADPSAQAAAEGRWRRHRARMGAPVVSGAVGALIIMLLAVGWWALSRESIAGTSGSPPGEAAPSGEAPSSGEAAGAHAEEEAAGGPSVAGTAAAGTAGRGTGGGASEDTILEAAVAEAPELPYSVLIASYARSSDAEESARELSGPRDGLFFVAPTPVRGRVYHRVLAGAKGDRAAARALMEELVESGRKAASSAWDVRPARLAFRLGVYGSRAGADAAAGEARAAGIPAYVVPAPAPGPDTAFQVYAGAYESEPAARALAALLERTGRNGELVTRRGSPR